MRVSDLHKRIFSKVLDPDAEIYINAVEFADGQDLEQDVKIAINDFVVGCKSDLIWDAIKASCILAGARTLDGAFIPLKGSAPTNINFISADYDRKIGLLGDGSTKYINTNRNNNTDPQNNQSMSVYRTALPIGGGAKVSIGAGEGGENGSTRIAESSTISLQAILRNRNSSAESVNSGIALGLSGMSRSASNEYNYYYNNINLIISRNSQTPHNSNIGVFNAIVSNVASSTYSNERISFYHVGEAINLALLNSRVTSLMNIYNSIL